MKRNISTPTCYVLGKQYELKAADVQRQDGLGLGREKQSVIQQQVVCELSLEGWEHL